MSPLPSPAQTREYLFAEVISAGDRGVAYADAYSAAFEFIELPSREAGMAVFEPAVAQLIDALLIEDKDGHLVATEYAYERCAQIIEDNGGWRAWFREMALPWVGDPEIDTLPERVANGSLSRGVVDTLTEPVASWHAPVGFKAPRRTFGQAVGGPLLVAAVGIAAVIVGPFAFLGGLLWVPVAATRLWVQRLRGRA